MQITNEIQLIDFINRKDVSYSDAEKLTNQCLNITQISFRDCKADIDTKENLIRKIKEVYQNDSSDTINGITIFWD